MKTVNGILMKRCPKCHFYNNSEVLECEKCKYIFKGKAPQNKSTNTTNDSEDEWPSDEWKDWNLM